STTVDAGATPPPPNWLTTRSPDSTTPRRDWTSPPPRWRSSERPIAATTGVLETDAGVMLWGSGWGVSPSISSTRRKHPVPKRAVEAERQPMSERAKTGRELPPEAMGNEKWHDTTHAVWLRSSLSKEDSEAIVEVAEFDDGFRA